MSDYQETIENFDDPCYTNAIKAGRRTYFFDVKATRGDDLFITITESRKRSLPNGGSTYDRQTMFLYKEDFARFSEGLQDVIGYVKDQLGEIEERPEWTPEAQQEAEPSSEAVEQGEETKKKGLFGLFS